MIHPSEPKEASHLLPNLLHFARLLRRLGLAVSAGQIADLAHALTHVDLARRDDVYHAMRCILAHSLDERVVFDRAFEVFWAGEQAWVLAADASKQVRVARRAAEDLPGSDEVQRGEKISEDAGAPEEEPDAADAEAQATYSPIDILRRKDFASYTEEELQAAQRFIESLVWRLSEHPTRRRERAAKRAAYLDLPATIRHSIRYGGEIVAPAWRRRKHKPRPLTVICDVSGSMDRYSRLFLHFIYALGRGPQRVEAFVFGTRLTRITPALRHHDVDRVLDDVSGLVQDWAGGTRIGESLKTFNFTWARRTLGRGAVVIVISDGWDRGDIALLEREIGRLRRSVHRLIWLNPLLGAADYQPLALGIRTVLPYVDDFLPLHNLASLEELALQLGSQTVRPG
ncbi:MAG: VWA domain-containing protein [Chloroflexi bacterium]|nr:VWA domain-containing protein [Chloroflexota bacterium]